MVCYRDSFTLPLPFALKHVGVEIATVCGVDGPGSIPGSARFFSSPQRAKGLWGPPSLLFHGYVIIPPRIKREECEADYSPPSSAEVKNGGAIPPFPRIYSW
jgi:hypothetical protein